VLGFEPDDQPAPPWTPVPPDVPPDELNVPLLLAADPLPLPLPWPERGDVDLFVAAVPAPVPELCPLTA